MTRITFHTGSAATIVCSMAEGMWENARDDAETQDAAHLDELLKVIAKQTPADDANGFTVLVADDLRETAEDVIANCLDNYGGRDEDTLEDGDVTIEEVSR